MNDSDLEEIKKSFTLVMKMLAEQRLDIETLRVVLRAQGVTDDEIQHVRSELKDRWDAKADALIERIKSQRTVEQLRQLLESAEGKPQ